MNVKAASVIATTVSFAAVPLLMGAQNWDDHDRSTKYMARDSAKNTLESCDKNGILITNGDNDTFPVWYCQEVEGVRTDVRVINSALAGSYWHIQPLFKRIYDAAPVPFTLKREQYGQGKNDNVYLDNKDFGEYKELSQLMKFIANEGPGSKLNDGRGSEVSVLPTRKVKITIDAADLVKKGIITEEQATRTAPYIQWTIDPDYSNYIGRSSLAFIDILASSNWERPIHLASPYAQRNIFPSPQFAEMNGCAHKLVPYTNPNKEAVYRNENGINTGRTYDLFMNKFEWGNLNNPKTLIDPESLQTARVTRQQYAFLAQALLYEGKKDSAVKALDKALYFFPRQKIYFDSDMLFFAEIYYRAGAKDKGEALSKELIDIFETRIKYFESFPSKFSKNVRKELQESVSALYTLKNQILVTYGENELATRVDGILAGRI